MRENKVKTPPALSKPAASPTRPRCIYCGDCNVCLYRSEPGYFPKCEPTDCPHRTPPAPPHRKEPPP